MDEVIQGNIKKAAQTKSFSPISLFIETPDIAIISKKLGNMQSRAPSVMMNALNKSLTVINHQLSANLHERYAYRKRLAKPKYRRAKRDSLYASLTYSGRKVNLLDFEHDKGKYGSPRNLPGRQLAAKVLSGSGLDSIPRAFVMPSYSNIPKRIAIRLTSSGRDGKALRVAGLYGPTEAAMVGKTWNQEKTQSFSQKTLSEKLDEQINNQYLKKWGLK